MVVIPTRTPVESSKESPLESAIRTVPGEREQAEVSGYETVLCPITSRKASLNSVEWFQALTLQYRPYRLYIVKHIWDVESLYKLIWLN